MKRLVRKEFILAVGSCLIVMLIAGCEEEKPSAVKENKIIAYENRQLKEQMAQREKEFGEQTAQLEKKIEEQNKLLEECRRKEKIPEGMFREELDAKVSEIMDIFGQANMELSQENSELRTQVEELQTQVKKLEQQLKNIESPAEPQPLTQ
jgi:outer membrane murein-binding lipoprotein Lpp